MMDGCTWPAGNSCLGVRQSFVCEDLGVQDRYVGMVAISNAMVDVIYPAPASRVDLVDVVPEEMYVWVGTEEIGQWVSLSAC